MTTSETAAPGIAKPKDRNRAPVPVRERIAEAQRNHDYFMAHRKELFERYPDHWLLIHSGSEVVPFDDLMELMALRDTLDELTRRGSIVERRRTGMWILRAAASEVTSSTTTHRPYAYSIPPAPPPSHPHPLRHTRAKLDPSYPRPAAGISPSTAQSHVPPTPSVTPAPSPPHPREIRSVIPASRRGYLAEYSTGPRAADPPHPPHTPSVTPARN